MTTHGDHERSLGGGSLAIVGGRVLTTDGVVESDIEVRDGVISRFGSSAPAADTTIDARGLFVVPGFIDLQINGGFGHDFTNDPSSIWEVGRRLPTTGVTGFLPTIITSPPKSIDAAMEVLDAGPPPGYVGAVPLGLHLEGPFLSPKRPGVHPPDLLRAPDTATVEAWTEGRHVRIVTLAPELPGGLELVERLAGRGVVVAAGHSDASYEQALAASEAGVSLGTHLFNAMPPLHHRAPGLVGALLTDPRAAVSLIVDGLHVHPAMVELTWRAKGRDRFVLVTDAMAAMGLSPGSYRLGDVAVTVGEDGPRDPAGRLAGSTLTLDAAIRNLIEFTGCSMTEGVRAGAASPASLLGDPTRGRLEIGARADVVVLDDQLQVVATVVAGRVAYLAGASSGENHGKTP